MRTLGIGVLDYPGVHSWLMCMHGLLRKTLVDRKQRRLRTPSWGQERGSRQRKGVMRGAAGWSGRVMRLRRGACSVALARTPGPWHVRSSPYSVVIRNPPDDASPGAFRGLPVSLCSSCQARPAAASGEPCITRPATARSFGRRRCVSIEYPFPLGGKNVKDPIAES